MMNAFWEHHKDSIRFGYRCLEAQDMRQSVSRAVREGPKNRRRASFGEMQARIATLEAELGAAREREAAAAEIVAVINSSPGDLAPVFDAMLQEELSLCGAASGELATFDGVAFRAAAWRGYEPGPGGATVPAPGMALSRNVLGEQIVHIPDITADDVYRSGNAVRRRLADEFGGRTAIWVALRKDLGCLAHS